MSRLSAIMALKVRGRHYADNIGRCDIMFESFRHFGLRSLISEWLIVIPGSEEEYIRRHARAWSDFPIRFVVEDEYLAVFKRFSKLHEVRGWHRQQIIKLFCAERVQNDYFLVLDPDVFAVKPMRYEELVLGGRAIVEEDRREWHADWWTSSAELLGVEPRLEQPGMGVTPAILSREVCRGLTAHIEQRHAKSWHEVLLSSYMTQWTEYTLYHLFAENSGLFNRYHVYPSAEGVRQRLHSPAPWGVWKPGDYERLDFRALFSAKNPGLFSVVQSNVGVTPQRVAKDLAPYVPVRVQNYERETPSIEERLKELYGATLRRAMMLARTTVPESLKALVSSPRRKAWLEKSAPRSRQPIEGRTNAVGSLPRQGTPYPMARRPRDRTPVAL
jgi:L-rhamnose mutarotase